MNLAIFKLTLTLTMTDSRQFDVEHKDLNRLMPNYFLGREPVLGECRTNLNS